jgi:hypothetical protein
MSMSTVCWRTCDGGKANLHCKLGTYFDYKLFLYKIQK